MVTSFPLSFPCVPNIFCFLGSMQEMTPDLSEVDNAYKGRTWYETVYHQEVWRELWQTEKGKFYKRLLITMHQDMCWKLNVKALCSTDSQAHWTSDSCAKNPTKMAWFKYHHMLRNSKPQFHQLENNNSFHSMFLYLVLCMFLQHIILFMVCIMARNAEWTCDFSTPIIMFQ
jgi:hypothetical protein